MSESTPTVSLRDRTGVGRATGAGREAGIVRGAGADRETGVGGGSGRGHASGLVRPPAESRAATDGSRPVRSASSQVNPYRSEVERVLLKGATGRVEILRQLHKLEMMYPVQAHLVDATLNCFNTRYLQRRLEQEISNAGRYAQQFSLIGWEVDGYEAYVRQYGERWGVVALKEIVAMVKAVTRRGDVCAHVGVSRFALFLPNISMEGAGRVAEKIRLRVRHQRFPLPGEQSGRLTVSFGAVHYGEDGADAATLLGELDRRVTEARSAGGDQGRVGDQLA